MCVDGMWTLLMKYIVTPYETSPRQSLHSTEPSRQHELINIITGALIGNLRLQFYVEVDNGWTAGRRIQIVIKGNDHAVRHWCCTCATCSYTVMTWMDYMETEGHNYRSHTIHTRTWL